MIWRFRAAAAAMAAVALSGCMTERVRPEPSQAVVEARAARAAKAAACADALPSAPISAPFGFQTAELSETGKQRLDAAGRVLACRPAARVVIQASADQRGTEAEQAALADQRRAAVAAYLARAGVEAGRIAAGPAPAPAAAPGGDVLVIHAEGQGW